MSGAAERVFAQHPAGFHAVQLRVHHHRPRSGQADPEERENEAGRALGGPRALARRVERVV